MATKTKTLRAYKKMPKGYKVDKGATMAPRGTVMITNGKSFFGGQRKQAYLVVDEKLYNERKKKKTSTTKKTASAAKPVSRTAKPVSRTAKPVSRTAKPVSRTAKAVSKATKRGKK